MNTIKRQLVKIYQEAQYHKNMFYNRLCGKRGGYIDNSRQLLIQISPKPNGYYKGAVNQQTNSAIDLSIIVPVYNTERYLPECLDSILQQQTDFNYEILCIDDGSPDGSLEILRQYEKRYSAVRVIHQDNRGFSGARNRGLDEAVGRYVMFVDSDDRIKHNTIQIMMDAMEKGKYDIVCSGFCMFNEKEEKTNYLEEECTITGMGYKGVSRHQCYFWGKIYKRSFWKNIRLAEGYLFEDMSMLHVLSRLCNGYRYIPRPLYEYRWNSSGISNTAPTTPKSVDQYWMIEFIEEELDRLGIEKNAEIYRGLLKEMGPYLFSRTKKLPESTRQIVFSCASDKANSWKLSNKDLNKSEKRIVYAFYNRNFYQWEAVSSSWHE